MGDMPELVDGLTLTALVAGALEYAILMRHRETRRYDLRMDASIAEAGLRGLVRVVLIDEQIPRPRRPFHRMRDRFQVSARSAARRVHPAAPARRP
jgi:hypothetical protein